MNKQEKEFRDKVYAVYERNRINLDQSILKISALGIPLTIAFNNSILKTGCYPWLFGIFIGLWALTTALVIASMISADEMLKSKLDKKPLRFFTTTNVLNWIATISFFLGFIAIVVYAALNI